MPIRCSRKTRDTLAAALLLGVPHLLGLSHPCWASPITFSSASLASAVRLSVPDPAFLSDGASGFDSELGSATFQGSDLVLGNGPMADPKPFSFEHTSALNTAAEMPGSVARAQTSALSAAPDLAKALDLTNESGPLNATDPSDPLSVHAATPSRLGDKLLTLDPATLTSAAYEDPTPLHVGLTASDAERLRLLLVGVGVFAVLILAAVGHRSLGVVEANIPPAPIRKPIMGKAWVQRGTTFCPPAKDGARSAQAAASLSESSRAERRSGADPQPSTA